MLSFLTRRLYSNLYTWGKPTSTLGHDTPKSTTQIPLPKLLDLQTPIKKCFLGPNHSVILTDSGDVYSFGNGTYGALGHNSQESFNLPKKISALSDLGIRAKDVSVGEHHTVILTSTGEVWTTGYGGDLAGGWFRHFISQKGGGLGHGDLSDKLVPTLIQSLKNTEAIELISVGDYHSIAVGKTGSVYVWGNGKLGVLGTGNEKTCLHPHRNEFFEEMKLRNITVKKIQSYNYCNIALMSNGKLFCWGFNDFGQLALGNPATPDMNDLESTPTEPDFFKSFSISDFELGEECSVFRTNDDRIFYSGSQLSVDPVELNVPIGAKIRSIFACKKIGGYVTGDNRVFANGKLFEKSLMEEAHSKIWKVKSEVFKGLTVEKIGGQSTSNFCFLI